MLPPILLIISHKRTILLTTFFWLVSLNILILQRVFQPQPLQPIESKNQNEKSFSISFTCVVSGIRRC